MNCNQKKNNNKTQVDIGFSNFRDFNKTSRYSGVWDIQFVFTKFTKYVNSLFSYFIVNNKLNLILMVNKFLLVITEWWWPIVRFFFFFCKKENRAKMNSTKRFISLKNHLMMMMMINFHCFVKKTMTRNYFYPLDNH